MLQLLAALLDTTLQLFSSLRRAEQIGLALHQLGHQLAVIPMILHPLAPLVQQLVRSIPFRPRQIPHAVAVGAAQSVGEQPEALAGQLPVLHFLGQRTQLTQHFGQLRVEIRVHLAIRRGALLQLQANLAERVADEQWLVGPCQGVPAFQHRRGIAGLGQAPPHVAQPPVVELETCTERLAYQPQQGSQFLEALARLMHPFRALIRLDRKRLDRLVDALQGGLAHFLGGVASRSDAIGHRIALHEDAPLEHR